jgi:hypothetical protein
MLLHVARQQLPSTLSASRPDTAHTEQLLLPTPQAFHLACIWRLKALQTTMLFKLLLPVAPPLTSWYLSMHLPRHFCSLLLRLLPGLVMHSLKQWSRTVCDSAVGGEAQV